MMSFARGVGSGVIDGVVKLGVGARLFALLLAQSGLSFRRLRLTIGQVHFIGNYSLIIIVVSGLFVGFVLGLQGYNTLQRYGSEQALGLLVALSLVRELGPVITALLFAGPPMADTGTCPSCCLCPKCFGLPALFLVH